MPRLTFGQRKLNSILAAIMGEMLVGVVLSMTDSAIIGYLIGLDALAAVNTIMPLTTFSLFLGIVISSGATLAYSNEIGAFRQEKAHCVFGLALLMELFAGAALFLIAVFALPAYVRYIGLPAAVTGLLRDYMRFYSFFLLFRPLKTLLSAMVFCDGGEKVGAASSIADSVGNAFFSLLLGWRFGIRGISLGTLLSSLLAFGILFSHISNRRSSLRVRFSFSAEDLLFIVRTGVNSDTMFLYFGLLCALCSHIVTKRFGAEYLPMLTVLYAMIELNVALESAGEAIKPLTAAYLAEKNLQALRSLMRYTLRLNLLTGAFMSLLTLAAANLIPCIFGLDKNIAVYSVCVKGLRIYAISFMPMAWLAFYDSHWLYIGRQWLSFFSNTLKYFLCAAVLVPLFSRFLGPAGLWTGFALAPVLSLLIICLTGVSHYGRKRFPDLLEEDRYHSADFSLILTAEEIIASQRQAEAFLREENVQEKTVNRAALAIEELLLLIAEKNPDRAVYAECFLRVAGERVTMVLWDSGTAFDITDEDLQLSGLRSFVVSSIMSVTRDRLYQLSVGLNRCRIQFMQSEDRKA